ncbi:GntR family transcriptional regulator [Echinicola sp. CAU 1574]|uniref:GntR family transcriptional regulator n=1 Tax=Echinicola arenosa TaxID=2774144 RepID=A0ABR9AP79_9BACT|nr:GntR family transcriptional regulator [Echinicola arenosa]MBD8489710.1 GntR family transcriptional regulator [Echinicola arenosa]
MNLVANGLFLQIDSESRIPKYQQIVDSIIKNIENGYLKVGEKLPSINDISEEYYLSRDTVVRAYNLLREKKIITSVVSKGFYVNKAINSSNSRILFILNKLSNYKLEIFNTFVNSMGSDNQIDLRIYHCDSQLLVNILEENIGAYDHFVVMPHFKDNKSRHTNHDENVLKCLQRFPKDKLVIMDNYLPELGEDIACIYQDFKMDIYNALEEAMDQLKKYKKLILAFPDNPIYPYPKEIKQGFLNFCNTHKFDAEVLDKIYPDMELQEKDAYIVIDENDLVSLVKQTRDMRYEIGKDIGVVSYNDTPLKELFDITVISTDFELMAESAAYMIKKHKQEVVPNIFSFIDRGSL